MYVAFAPSEPYLFEKVEQPEFAKKTVGTEFGSLLSLPGVCTHSYLSGLDFMAHITENNSELKPTFLLDMLKFKKIYTYKTVMRLLFFN